MSSVQTVSREKTSVIGQPLKRMEDPKFITGTGRFADDLSLPRMLHGVFVRSLYGHARVKGVDVSGAVSHPGVRLVLTGRGLSNSVNKMPTAWGGDTKSTDRPVLPLAEVNFAGEAVALVVAEDLCSAEDGAEIVGLYDLLLRLDPSPVVGLNRAVAVAMRDGPAAGLDLVDAILARGDLADYRLAHAARADLCRRLGRTADARTAYERALALTHQEAERRFIERRLAELAI